MTSTNRRKKQRRSIKPKAASLINKIDKSLVRLAKKKEDINHQYQEKRDGKSLQTLQMSKG